MNSGDIERRAGSAAYACAAEHRAGGRRDAGCHVTRISVRGPHLAGRVYIGRTFSETRDVTTALTPRGDAFFDRGPCATFRPATGQWPGFTTPNVDSIVRICLSTDVEERPAVVALHGNDEATIAWHTDTAVYAARYSCKKTDR